jgi:hypothetical protein
MGLGLRGVVKNGGWARKGGWRVSGWRGRASGSQPANTTYASSMALIQAKNAPRLLFSS